MSSVPLVHSGVDARSAHVARLGERLAAAPDLLARVRAVVTYLSALPGVRRAEVVLETGGGAWAGEGNARVPPRDALRTNTALQAGGTRVGEILLWSSDGAPEAEVLLELLSGWMTAALYAPVGSQRQFLAARMPRATKAWGLTERQVRVLGHVVLGLSNKEIAALLHCAERTVEIHVTELLRRSGSSIRAMLTARFWSELPG